MKRENWTAAFVVCAFMAMIGLFAMVDKAEATGTNNPGPSGGGISQTDADARYLQLSGGTMAGNIGMAGNLITDLSDAVEIGAACTSGATGDACFGDDIHVEGKTFTNNLESTGTTYIGDTSGDVVRIKGTIWNSTTHSLRFEGVSNDSFEINFWAGDPTSDHDVYLPDNTGVLGIIDTVVAAVPAEPRTCDATSFGQLVLSDDNNDTAHSALCVCAINADDSTYDWRDAGDIAGTACPHF